MYVSVAAARLWKRTEVMNIVLPKDFPSFGVLIMLESRVCSTRLRFGHCEDHLHLHQNIPWTLMPCRSGRGHSGLNPSHQETFNNRLNVILITLHWFPVTFLSGRSEFKPWRKNKMSPHHNRATFIPLIIICNYRQGAGINSSLMTMKLQWPGRFSLRTETLFAVSESFQCTSSSYSL